MADWCDNDKEDKSDGRPAGRRGINASSFRENQGVYRDGGYQGYSGGGARDGERRGYGGSVDRDGERREYGGSGDRDAEIRGYVGGADRDGERRGYRFGAERDGERKGYCGSPDRDGEHKGYGGGADHDGVRKIYGGGGDRDAERKGYGGGSDHDEGRQECGDDDRNGVKKGYNGDREGYRGGRQGYGGGAGREKERQGYGQRFYGGGGGRDTEDSSYSGTRRYDREGGSHRNGGYANNEHGSEDSKRNWGTSTFGSRRNDRNERNDMYGCSNSVDENGEKTNDGRESANNYGGGEGWENSDSNAGKDHRRGFGRGGGSNYHRSYDGGNKFGRGGGRRGDGDPDVGDDYNKENNLSHSNERDKDLKPREFYIPPKPTDNEDEIFDTGISSGINFSKYENISIQFTGENPPECITSFERSGLRESLLNNVKKSRYEVPTPIQKAAIPAIMDGRDLMACAQTGSGKTAAFLLPIINYMLLKSPDLSIGRPHVVIISPTRELAIQIFHEARKFALGTYLKVAIIYGGTSTKHQNENINKGCHILICTLGRLIDFSNRCFITFEDTRFLVLDEADRMLDMGFKDEINKIFTHETMRPNEQRQNLMFSATFPKEIQMLAGDYLKNYLFLAIGVVGGACSDVKQNIFEVSKYDKRSKLMELLQEEAEGTIVFVETKRNADFLASLLSETEFPTTSIHGDRMQSQREMALNDFRNGTMKVLIATSVAARGLDIRNIKHVVNYDLPKSIDEYVHRIGRTGRLGNKGRATSFYDPDCDSALGSDLVKIMEGADQEIPDFLKQFKSGNGEESYFSPHDVRTSPSRSAGQLQTYSTKEFEVWH